MATTSTHGAVGRPACGHFRKRVRTGLGPFVWSALIIVASIIETWQSPAERGLAVLTLVLVGIGVIVAAVLVLRTGDEEDQPGEEK
ncbi:hypothetical protein [Saccharopolyspora gloriosae]|uniref:hypothetical protein n=1 Tax=Saccharopolyspora gloriosae TaxID=455344 RepID=UPI001FB67D76|nr:hypothetical protein [Saccharopolyspora gloriosae]